MSEKIKQKAIRLRRSGLTYSEIANQFSPPLAKGTLSGWLKNIELSIRDKEQIQKKQIEHLKKARTASLVAGKKNREKYFANIEQKLNETILFSGDKHVKKLILAFLYLAEGKKQGGSTSFGNASPEIIRYFLLLLRACYLVDEQKFRVTVQCRADQDVIDLQDFWSHQTNIPQSQFYKTRIDKRSIGKKTQKESYKGVCRVDYFSAEVFNELTLLANLVMRGP